MSKMVPSSIFGCQLFSLFDTNATASVGAWRWPLSVVCWFLAYQNRISFSIVHIHLATGPSTPTVYQVIWFGERRKAREDPVYHIVRCRRLYGRFNLRTHFFSFFTCEYRPSTLPVIKMPFVIFRLWCSSQPVIFICFLISTATLTFHWTQVRFAIWI